jgi:predicted outer membrane repeat protein
MVLCLFFLICLAACTNNTSSSPPYTPGCIADELIRDINLANNLSGPAVINLPPNCLYTLTKVENTRVLNNQTLHSGLPHIDNKITINGNNAVIDILLDPGEPYIGHLFVKADGDLELYDLTLQNGVRYVGGAVVVYEGDLFASNTKFLNNLARSEGGDTVGKGGSIYNESGMVTIIDNSLFQDNLAGYSTGVGNHLGGAIYSKNGTLTVYSSSFDTNAAAGNGGAIYTERDSSDVSGGLVVIEDSSFSGNWAYQDGGAIALVDEINGATFITDSEFLENHADVSGGAIYSKASELKADFDTFENNLAAFGGAIYTKRSGGGNPSILSSDESTYDTNSASQIGGAIYSENSDLYLDESEFKGNTASSCGAIRIGGHPYLEGETWEPGAELGAELSVPATVEINGGRFEYNEAWLTHGGAICHLQGELSIQDTVLAHNQAEKYGGVLLLVDKSDLSGLLMSSNVALRNGGAVSIGYPFTMVQIPGESDLVDPSTLNFPVRIINSNLFNNWSGGVGAGLYVNVGGRVSISKSTFKTNWAISSGGGIFQAGGDLFITNSTFSQNSASNGGGLYASGCTVAHSALDIKHSTFAHNIATNPLGGGGLNYRGEVNIQNSLVTQSTNQDCRYSQCPSNNFSVPGSVDSDGSCGFSVTETYPKIGPLAHNGGIAFSHALLSGSPLINIAPDCAGLTDDQRGVHRPLPDPGDCDPGSYEFDPSDPPTMASMEPSPTPDPDISTTLPCDLFDELQYAVVLSNLAPETSELTLYIKLAEGGLDFWDAQGDAAYFASLGDAEAEGFQEQGFPGRIYFNFTLPGSAAGSVQDFQLFRDDCDDPLISIPQVSIPEPDSPDPDQPSLVCKKGLDKGPCEKAGGTYVDHGLAAPPECVCP